MPRIRALLFDFDGLILDTGGPALASWQETYRSHGAELTLDAWSAAVGTLHAFDPVAHLSGLTGVDLDPARVRGATQARHAQLLLGERLRPGIAELVRDALAHGLEIAVVSSSDTAWVTSHLDRRGLLDGWHAFHSAHRQAQNANPHPDLYLAALASLGLEPGEAIALEDSPNGVAAAKAAGLLCVAVPNDVTRMLDLGGADLVVGSLADLPLVRLLAWAGDGPAPAQS